MTSARDAILDRLRVARASARLPRVDAPLPPAPQTHSLDECLNRFMHEASAIGVECTREPTLEGLRARVGALVTAQGVLSWDPPELPYGIGDLIPNAVRGSSTLAQQAAADIGVTGCDAAIAETGSLVMLSAPGRSRAVSLLPPMHLAIVRPEDLYFSMGDFFESRATEVVQRASCTFITGPSRTADIELTLTLGIHGPGHVIVIVGPAQNERPMS